MEKYRSCWHCGYLFRAQELGFIECPACFRITTGADVIEEKLKTPQQERVYLDKFYKARIDGEERSASGGYDTWTSKKEQGSEVPITVQKAAEQYQNFQRNIFQLLIYSLTLLCNALRVLANPGLVISGTPTQQVQSQNDTQYPSNP